MTYPTYAQAMVVSVIRYRPSIYWG